MAGNCSVSETLLSCGVLAPLRAIEEQVLLPSCCFAVVSCRVGLFSSGTTRDGGVNFDAEAMCFTHKFRVQTCHLLSKLEDTDLIALFFLLKDQVMFLAMSCSV